MLKKNKIIIKKKRLPKDFSYMTRILPDQTICTKVDAPGWAPNWSPAGHPGQIAGWVPFLKRGGQVPRERERKSLEGLQAAAAHALQPGEGIWGVVEAGAASGHRWRETRASTEVRGPGHPAGSRWEGGGS